MTALLEQQRCLQREVVRLLTAESSGGCSAAAAAAATDVQVHAPVVKEVAPHCDACDANYPTETCSSSLKSNGSVDGRWLKGFERRLSGQIRRTVRQEIRKVVATSGRHRIKANLDYK